jgi:hypothetical protein
VRSESKPAAFRLAPTDEVSDRNNCTCNVRVAKSGQFHHGALKWSASKRPAAIDRVTNDILAGCGRELLARVRQDHASAPASDPHAGVAPGDDDSESCGSRLCVGEPIRACLVDAQHCGQCDRRFLCGLAHPQRRPGMRQRRLRVDLQPRLRRLQRHLRGRLRNQSSERSARIAAPAPCVAMELVIEGSASPPGTANSTSPRWSNRAALQEDRLCGRGTRPPRPLFLLPSGRLTDPSPQTNRTRSSIWRRHRASLE